MNQVAHFHLPGLFEFHELYKAFLPLYKEHREYFNDFVEIDSIYGTPSSLLWSGGRIENSECGVDEVISFLNEYGLSGRLTLSNSLLKEEHLLDEECNKICSIFNRNGNNGAIVHSELLMNYLRERYSGLYLVSSTTKVITDFSLFKKELDREEFSYVVPDFRLNKEFEKLGSLTQNEKDKVEFLLNECCYIGCNKRKECYESVSKKSLGYDDGHICSAPDSQYGYRFSSAMKNPSFISIEDIENVYLPMGFSNFKIEGRGLGSAIVFEMLLYYLVKKEYQLKVREEVYLDNMLDLF